MSIPIQIPRLGWSMEEGNFSGWLKKDGDSVTSGEPLFTLEGEKAAQDIEATETGVLRIPKDGPKPGDVVKVGQVIGELLLQTEIGKGADRSSPTVTQATQLHHSSPVLASAKAESALSGTGASQRRNEAIHEMAGCAVSPRARRRASELGIDTQGLRGQGRSGRVTEADVLRAAATRPASKMSTMRRTIAERTAASFSSVPHFYLRSEIDGTALSELRQDLLPSIEAETGVRLSLTDLIVRAQSLALKAFPAANAIWVDGEILSLSSYDVGLAVALPEGLTIPILRSPGIGKLAALVRQRASQVEAARSNKLTLDQLQGGATSLSNLGNTRVDEFAAVIPPPHSTILAVGRAALRPYVVNGKVEARSTIKLCLSIDHRVLDGAPAAEFLGILCDLLESPSKLIATTADSR